MASITEGASGRRCPLACWAAATCLSLSCATASEVAPKAAAIERSLRLGSARSPLLRHAYESLDEIGRRAELTRRAWGGVNKRRTGGEVHLYVVDHGAFTDQWGCVPGPGSTCRGVPSFADNCVVFGAATIVCDARLIAKVARYTADRALKLTIMLMIQDFVESTLSPSQQPHGRDPTMLEMVESLLVESRGLQTIEGFGSDLAGMSMSELTHLERCEASYEACLQELEAADTAGAIFGVGDQMSELFRAAMAGYLGFIVLHELGHIELGHTDGPSGVDERDGADERDSADREGSADDFALGHLQALASPFSGYVAPYFFVELSRTFILRSSSDVATPIDSMAAWEEIGEHEMQRLADAYVAWACAGSHTGMLDRFLHLVRGSTWRYPDFSELQAIESALATACRRESLDSASFRRYGAWLLSL